MLSELTEMGVAPVSIAVTKSRMTPAWPSAGRTAFGGIATGRVGRSRPSPAASGTLPSNWSLPSQRTLPPVPTIRQLPSQAVSAPSAHHDPR